MPHRKAPSQIPVMIVEDSRVVREFLEYIITQDPRLRVVASVGSGEEALKVLHKAAPKVISLDIRLPGMDGFELTKRIMSERPVPIVVVSSDVEDSELKISMNALRAGALAVVQKPVGLTHADYATVASEICTKLVIMSEVRVIRQRYSSRYDLSPTTRSYDSIPSSSPSTLPSRGQLEILGLVASTGGPNAVVRVLKDLGPNFPAPILLVQHITPGFVQGFVAWLRDLLGMNVLLAEHGVRVVPGTVYVAPANQHLEMGDRFTLKLTQDPPISLQRPSGTVLFRSLAREFGPSAAGVLLTGMGDDGALGLREMFDAGALTIAEAESTAVVYGMPAAAARLGAVCETLPLPEIGPQIARQFGSTAATP